jgi:uncharacterized membrane protein YccF (DUF307 family)
MFSSGPLEFPHHGLSDFEDKNGSGCRGVISTLCIHFTYFVDGTPHKNSCYEILCKSCMLSGFVLISDEFLEYADRSQNMFTVHTFWVLYFPLWLTVHVLLSI